MSRTVSQAHCAAVLLGVASLIAPAAHATPAETLAPTQNHLRGTVNASGTGFGASEAVDLFFDTADLQLAVTDGSGNFAATPLTVPTAATPGTHYITAIGRRTGNAAQKSFTVSTNWPKQGAGPLNLSANSYENVLSPDNVSGLGLLWRTDTGGSIYAAPTFYNSRVYVGSSDQKLYALNPDTGAIIWSVTSGNIYSGAAIVSNIVYVGTDDGKVHAYNASTGAPIWSYTTGAAIYGAPSVVNGLLYIESYDQYLYALNASSGALVWKASIAPNSLATPAVANGAVFTADSAGVVRANNAATGAPMWTYYANEVISGSVTVSNGLVFFGSYDTNNVGHLNAVNVRTGYLDHRSSISTTVLNSPAVANNVVFIGDSYGDMIALAARRDQTIWVSNTSHYFDAIVASEAVANGVVYYATEGGYIYANDASNGTVLWSATMSGTIQSSPAVVNGRLYVGSTNGSLYAYALDTGGPARVKPPSIAALRALQPRR